MDKSIFLYLNLLIPTRPTTNKDMDVLIKNIKTGLCTISVPWMNNTNFSAINIDVTINCVPPLSFLIQYSLHQFYSLVKFTLRKLMILENKKGHFFKVS